MNETAEMIPSPAPAPERLGQGTAIEQSRAAAEVQMMVYLARQYPRDPKRARERMLEACSHLELADDGFYAYPRGAETVTGMTVVAAVELATCWGNLLYGQSELRRDDVYGQSEYQAFAWDLETNVPFRHIFIVQHTRSTKKGSYQLTEPRDIYEMNTNEGSRRMREAIFKVLPRWYRTEAEKALKVTLFKEIGAESIQEGREKAIQFYRAEFGLRQDQLEHKLRKPKDKWKADDLIQLRILSNSLRRKDIRPDETFASPKVTAEELAEDAQAPAARARAKPAAALVEHADHPEGEWMDGCAGCMAESTSLDQEAADGDDEPAAQAAKP
jgi:hypothetical protein